MSQTWERLQITLRQLGHEAKKSLGQNFLISDQVIEKIIAKAQVFKPQSLLEIGPGPGALTFHLKEITKQFQVIELDRNFAAFWRDQGLDVVEADALQVDWASFFARPRPFVLVSNLPYQISSSLVIDRSLDTEPLDAMVLMFQKEVAQKIKAPQGHELYGMLSVVAQSFWDIEIVSEAGPRDFFPPPKVASRVLSFLVKPSPVANKERYFKLVKACFLHPRKLMSSNLAESGVCTKPKAAELFSEMKLSEKVRAEELKISQFLELYRRLYPNF